MPSPATNNPVTPGLTKKNPVVTSPASRSRSTGWPTLWTAWPVATVYSPQWARPALPRRNSKRPSIVPKVFSSIWKTALREGTASDHPLYQKCSPAYATLAAGGIIYSLSVFLFYFLARPYGLTIANIFIPSSLGGQKLLVK